MFLRLGLVIAATFSISACLPHPPPPAAPYHALGKDKQWTLIIDDKHVTFIPAGRQPIREPKPQPIIGVAGDIYRTPRIDVNIVHGSCTIGDRIYPDSVQVSIDGERHEGCGGL